MDFSWLIYPLAFVVTLGIVVSVHEFGHFIVARWCGVKVIRFAIGFGQPLLRWFDKKGTEFCVCMIPLGGYVRLLDSRVDDVPAAEYKSDFSNQPVWARIGVYVAGPVINLLLAIVVLALVAGLGVTEYKPVIGFVTAGSAAQKANLLPDDEIVAVDAAAVTSWESLSFKFVESAGRTGSLNLKVRRGDQELNLDVPVQNFMSDATGSPLDALGLVPKMHLIPAVLDTIEPKSPASEADWQPGDKILTLGSKTIDYWQDLYKTIQQHPNQVLTFSLERNNQIISGVITPAIMQSPDPLNKDRMIKLGRIGVGPKLLPPDSSLVRETHYGLFQAIHYGVVQTWVRTRLVVLSIGKLLTGDLALDNVTGPVTIAEIAGKTAQSSVSSFLNFLAYLSVSLGVFNLLPVPMLDGGHIAFGFYEVLRGKPLSVQAQQRCMTVGFALLASLMLLALFNDIMRVLH